MPNLDRRGSHLVLLLVRLSQSSRAAERLGIVVLEFDEWVSRCSNDAFFILSLVILVPAQTARISMPTPLRFFQFFFHEKFEIKMRSVA